jgi:hypothetical protein
MLRLSNAGVLVIVMSPLLMRSVGRIVPLHASTERSSKGLLRSGGCFVVVNSQADASEFGQQVQTTRASRSRQPKAGSIPAGLDVTMTSQASRGSAPATTTKHPLASSRARMKRVMPMKSGHWKSDNRLTVHPIRPARPVSEGHGASSGQSGDTQPLPIESLPSGAPAGCFDGFSVRDAIVGWTYA